MKNLKVTLLVAALIMSVYFAWANTLPETEPNNSFQTSKLLVLGDTLIGKIDSPSDEDFAKITIQPGSYFASINYPNGTPGFRDWFDVLDISGAAIAPHYCYYPGGDVHLYYFKVCTTTTVYFRARMNQDSGQPTNRNYSISFAADSLDLECDDTASSATIVNTPTIYSSRLALPGDNDWVKIPNVGAGVFSVALNNPTQPGIQLVADLFQDPTTGPISTSVGGSLNTNIAQPGAYFLRFRYLNADTASRFLYNASIVYLETLINNCDTAVVGVINTTKIGRTVTLQTVLQNVDSVSVNWGDGIISDSSAHTYSVDGTYTITITGFNICSSATAATQVKLVAGTFALGKIEGAAHTIVEVPFFSVDYEGSFSSVDGRITFDTSVAKLVGVKSGKMTVNQQGVNLSLGYISQTTGASAISIAPGDTIFMILFELIGNPGDSSEVDLNADGTFAAFYFDLGNNNPLIDAQLVKGDVKIFKNVELTIEAKTPNGVAVTHAFVTVFNGNTTLNAFTNAQGLAIVTVPYGDTLTVTVSKDTIIRTSINSQDAFIGQRIIVLLPVNGLTPYMIVATDINCDGKINSNDISLLLRWIVGLIPDFPCAEGQLVFIPETTVFPSYPNPNFFNFSKEGVIIHPDVTHGEKLKFVPAIRGDVNSSASAGLAGLDDRSETIWKYASGVENNGSFKVSLWANKIDELSGGGLTLEYDAANYELVQIRPVQALNEIMFVVNDKIPGKVNLAFINQFGQNIQFNHQLPLFEMILRSKLAYSEFYLGTAQDQSMAFDADGNAAKVLLTRDETYHISTAMNTPTVYPNPCKDYFYISLPIGSISRCEIYDILGRKVFEETGLTGNQLEVPTAHWKSGMYSCRMFVNDEIFTQTIQVGPK